MTYLRDDAKVSWDGYEDFLHKWSLSCNKDYVIKTKKEVALTAWEMFVYSHDSYFAKNHRDLSGLLFESLDFTSSVDARFASYQTFISCVDVHSNPFKSFRQTTNIYVRNYCYWLPDVIQANG
jgi:hypothetical protein